MTKPGSIDCPVSVEMALDGHQRLAIISLAHLERFDQALTDLSLQPEGDM